MRIVNERLYEPQENGSVYEKVADLFLQKGEEVFGIEGEDKWHQAKILFDPTGNWIAYYLDGARGGIVERGEFTTSDFKESSFTLLWRAYVDIA